ncbi:MAG: family 10 glycosylhydrolase [Bdellovibrionales bacterium]|nr:family 10 glycosylhydrolase [Bdellovibrionales bacterium]
MSLLRGHSGRSESSDSFRRALWVEIVHSPHWLDSDDELDGLFNFLHESNMTDVIVQVYRGGEPWWKSNSQRTGRGSAASLARLLEWGKQHSVKIHGWVNIFRSSNGLPPELNEKDLAASSLGGPEKQGKHSVDTDGDWIDPASSRMREFVPTLISSLLEDFPEFSGIHLDYFRYPYALPIRPGSTVKAGIDYGYGVEARGRFIAECTEGLDPFSLNTDGAFEIAGYSKALAWDQWRRDQVSQYLARIRDCISGRELSVAVVPWPDRAYLSAFQDWRGWLTEELVDRVYLMAYSRDRRMLGYLATQAAAFQRLQATVSLGLGAYLLEDLEELRKQIDLAKGAGLNGYAIFSYQSLQRSTNAILSHLSKE